MGFNNATMVVGASAIQAVTTHAQLHSAAAGSAGTTNVTSAARQAVTWTTPTGNGDYGLASPLNFTGGAGNGGVYSVTLWDASTGGNFRGEFVLTGDAAFNAAGEYSVTALGLDGTAT